jgi:23S rRNA-intervening sequence protein
MSRPSKPGPPVAVNKAYDFVLWLLPKVEKFPRSFRFTVGERLSAQGLEVLLLLVEAAYATDKEDLLNHANRKINGTRYLLRLAKDLHLLSVDSYGFAAECLDEIGRMVGGWRKATAGGK